MFCESLRQFWLLTAKNLILMKRSKLWTFFELVLPVLFTLPIVILVVKLADVSPSPALSFESVPVSGNAADLTKRVGFIPSISIRWCSKESLKLAYYSRQSPLETDVIMEELAAQFSDERQTLEVVPFLSFAEMLETLKEDAPNGGGSYGCAVNNYVGGVLFDALDLASERLSYKIFLSNSVTEMPLDWSLDRNWNEPYGQTTEFGRMPASPPYWSSSFLSLQYAIDSIFISNVSSSGVLDEPSVRFLRLPEPEYSVNSVAVFIRYLPILWGLCSFLTVIHAAREVAHEKFAVKAFLSVMGLSSPMFYLSHVFISWMKCCIIFLVCAIPLSTVMLNVSTSLFLFTVLLYGLGAVMFGVMMASFFKTPNSALKVTIVVWVVLVGVIYWKTPPTDNIFWCAISSLNINGAFYMAVNAMSDYMNRGVDLTWGNMFTGTKYRFTLGLSLIMILVDIIWMAAVTLLLDYVLGNTDFSLRSFFYSPVFDGTDSSDHVDLADSNESDGGLERSQPDIDVDGLVKIWGETGERAVDGLSLKAYRGQVTVLLGHNGAGKSTTFSMICGIFQPSAGTIRICQNDTRGSSSSKDIGLCPQGNALFDKLTVDEHLWFVHGLKGARGDYSLSADELINDLKLDAKKNELSMNLSGGMKRKLCVCMAVIGDSPVILLDEPTAGMDPGARRDVEHLLEKKKTDRTVLLTTHYMDEAELLGDRVAIMSRGRVVCSGSPQFLKKKFGHGYLLTVVMEDGKDARTEMGKLLPEASKFVEGATAGETHGRQLEIVLPKEQQESFPRLFEYLEKNKNSLHISSFGLSLNTLEQVFLKVGDLVDGASDNSTTDSEKTTLNRELIESQKENRRTGLSLLANQLGAIFGKRYHYAYRNWPQLVTQIAVPMLILILVAYLSNMNTEPTEDQSRSVSFENFGPSRVIFQSREDTKTSDAYLKMIQSHEAAKVELVAGQKNLTAEVVKLPKDLPAPGYGAVFKEDNKIDVLFNSRALHSLPTTMNALSNARLRAAGNIKAQINVSVGTYSPAVTGEDSLLVPTGVVDNVLGPLMLLALALVTSTFVMFLVEERHSKFAHQQSLTGISPFVFWGGSFLYDFLFYVLAGALFLSVFLFSGWMEGYLRFVVLMWLLYFFACVPSVYAISFIFSSASKANVLLVIWQIVAAFAAMFILFLVANMPQLGIDKAVQEIVRSFLLFVLPSFALGNGLMTLGAFSSMKRDPKLLWEWDNLGKNVVCMLAFGTFATCVFVAFQFKSVRYRFFQLWELKYGTRSSRVTTGENEDEDVGQERNRVEHGNLSDENTALEIKGLTKFFGNFCAVDDLSFAVKNGECFGLLGVNGAGKTTTFDILTGQSFPSRGSARVGDRNVTEQIAIGYCPQFDAMMMDLSGRETLLYVARMYGFENATKKVELVLKAVGMLEHGQKLVRYYSGGQRRKISVGLALLAPTRIVILDEPTAGIDPKARRDIWEVLSAVRDNSESSLLLTSHSMDECEALCSRIAVLNKGQMIAIGTSQSLKSKFGNTYTLTMVAAEPEKKETVIQAVAAQFPLSKLKTHRDSHSLTLKWQIPKSPSDRWSSMFAECLKLSESLPVSDFCLAQSSLEETFLRLAGQDPEGQETYFESIDASPASSPSQQPAVLQSGPGPA